MELAAGVETVSGDGARHGRPFLRGTRAQERLVHDFLVWPTLLFSVQPDYLLTYRLYPQDARRTLVVASIHFAADAFPGQACFAPEVYDFWTRANAEDQEICEQQQLGVESAGWRPGRFTRVEDGVHRFAQFVVRAYGGKAP